MPLDIVVGGDGCIVFLFLWGFSLFCEDTSNKGVTTEVGCPGSSVFGEGVGSFGVWWESGGDVLELSMVFWMGGFGREGSFEGVVVGFGSLVNSWWDIRFGKSLCDRGHEWETEQSKGVTFTEFPDGELYGGYV